MSDFEDKLLDLFFGPEGRVATFVTLEQRNDFDESKLCEEIKPDMIAERIIGVARHEGDMYLLTKWKDIPEPVYVNSELAKNHFALLYIKYLEDNMEFI